MKFTPRTLLSAVALLLGIIIALVPQNTTQPFKLTAPQLLQEIKSRSELISPDELAQWLVAKDPSIQLIDVRTPAEYERYHLDDALNIPLADILNKKYRDILDQDVKTNILYSNGTLFAQQAWMILRQLGYRNNYVLQGGLNYWFANILNPQTPSPFSPDEEQARFAFHKGVAQALGGGTPVVSTTPKKTTLPRPRKPILHRRKRKQAPEGGC